MKHFVFLDISQKKYTYFFFLSWVEFIDFVKSFDIPNYTGDPNSYARPDQVTTKHLHLELAADFTKKVLEGHVILTLVRTDPAADSVLLDASKLAVVGVREEDTGADLKWTLDSPSINGEKLRVVLPPGKEVK